MIRNGAVAPGQLTAYATPRQLPAYVPTTVANRYNPERNAYNWKASNTRRLRASFGKAARGVDQCHLHIGDSISAGAIGGSSFDRLHAWPLVYRDTLHTLGVTRNGTGLVRTNEGLNAGLTNAWTFAGTWSHALVVYSYSSVTNSTATWTSDLAGTAVCVVVYRGAGNSDFSIAVDGASSGAGFASYTGGSSGWTRHVLTGLANTTHTVVVKQTGAGTMSVLAAEVYTPNSGLAVHNVAESGSSAGVSTSGAAYSWSDTSNSVLYPLPAYGTAAIYQTPPKVAHIELGANDLLQGKTVAATTAAIQTIVTTLGTNFGGVDPILYAVSQPSGIAQATWESYVAALYQLADTLDCPLVDMHDRFGGYTAANANGLMGDATHMVAAGYADWGRNAALLAAA